MFHHQYLDPGAEEDLGLVGRPHVDDGALAEARVYDELTLLVDIRHGIGPHLRVLHAGQGRGPGRAPGRAALAAAA